MKEGFYRHENVPPIQESEISDNPNEAMLAARTFFESQGFRVDDSGFLDITMTESQVEQLATWSKSRTVQGIEMPTKDDFYKKVYLAASLWRQVQDGTTMYLFGKGIGVEIALRGNVQHREKRNITFPYRTHSDFELYGVDYEAAENGAYISGEVYPDSFQKVFGSQEYFPLTRTKGFKKLPPHLLHDTEETVTLGDIKVKIPQLELLFLDKWLKGESTPRSVEGKEISDAEALAKQYVLDKEKIKGYLQEFIIQPLLNDAEQTLKKDIEDQLNSISRLLRMGRKRLEEDGQAVNADSLAAFANSEIEPFMNLSDVSVGGVDSKYWIHLEGKDLTQDGIGEDLQNAITEKIRVTESERLDKVKSMLTKIDKLFDDIE